MKILLTGGTGFIGSHVAVELLQLGHNVTILDNLFNSKITVVKSIKKIVGKTPEFFKIDLLDFEGLRELFLKNKFDLVIHFAGLKAVGESVEKPLKYYENNVVGTINLLKCMREGGCKKIIFSSSATVYGENKTKKYTEDMQTGTKIASPYGKTKYMIEEILRDEAASDKDFEVGILRYFNPVGAHQSGLIGEDPNGVPNNLMPIIMKVYKGEISELSVYGNDYDTPDGTCKRDYIHVVDLAKGHVVLAENMKPGFWVYNLGTGKSVSVLEMIKFFERASNSKLPYKIAPRRNGDLPEFCADVSKAKEELGWAASLTIEDAMKDTINFLKISSN